MSRVLPAKIYPLSIPAGGSFPLMVHGSMFKVLSASGPLTVTGDTFGQLGQVLAGQGLEDAPYQRLVFTDTSGAVNNVQVLIAGAGFIDDRITGSVEVIDGGKSRTLSNLAFIGSLSQAAIAGQWGAIQLQNVSADKRIVVEQITFQVTGADGVALYVDMAAMAAGSGVGFMRNKHSGAPDSTVGKLFRQTFVGYPGAGIAAYSANLAASSSTTFKLSEPIVLDPGRALSAVASSVNNAIGMSVESYEESI